MQGWTADDYEVGGKGKAADLAEDPVKPDDVQEDDHKTESIVKLDTTKTPTKAEEGGANTTTRELAVDSPTQGPQPPRPVSGKMVPKMTSRI